MAGRYLNKKPKKSRKGLKITLIVLGIILGLLIIGAVAGYIYMRHMLGFINTVEPTVPTTAPVSVSTTPTESVPSSENEDPVVTESTEATEETWPEVVSTQNVTTIMLVGQNYRWGETTRLSDTMILCTINRETNTLTMTSLLRDMYVPLPAYAGHGAGRNRINVCYHLGTEWTGSVKGGMEMLALCVEQNFGIPIDHTVEVGFDSFEKVIDLLGGVEIELTEAEAKYLTDEIGYVGSFEPGLQTLSGIEALAYCRIRAIDSDFGRTDRQRTLINSLIDECRTMKLWDLHKMATEVLPLITTDMTTDEMTNYIWEFLPMLADLNIVSQHVPLEKGVLPDGAWSYSGKEIEGVGWVLEPNIWSHRQYLQEQLGYADK